ncbi:MAG: bifunctional adenosylcobinamide kinase/adenosylcobinamide-phosphate guanylyltransferase [Campylobacterales bacterium]
MKALFIGGIKSGKSLNAQNYILKHSNSKPIYLATTEFIDDEMQLKIKEHQENRKDDFITLEEPLKLYDAISKKQEAVLVECVSMWINNMLYHNFTFEDMQDELKNLFTLQNNIVFVINDVSNSVVSANKLTREFVNISGKLSQYIASECDEVYNTVAGISIKIK